ncbi:hypothetical protein FB45DRAFT_1064381, partial [Roridomyces roridus]
MRLVKTRCSEPAHKSQISVIFDERDGEHWCMLRGSPRRARGAVSGEKRHWAPAVRLLPFHSIRASLSGFLKQASHRHWDTSWSLSCLDELCALPITQGAAFAPREGQTVADAVETSLPVIVRASASWWYPRPRPYPATPGLASSSRPNPPLSNHPSYWPQITPSRHRGSLCYLALRQTTDQRALRKQYDDVNTTLSAIVRTSASCGHVRPYPADACLPSACLPSPTLESPFIWGTDRAIEAASVALPFERATEDGPVHASRCPASYDSSSSRR